MPDSRKRRKARVCVYLPKKPPPYVGPRARAVRVGRNSMTVELKDGRTLKVPLSALPGLAAAPPAARREFRLIGNGIGIHFPLCDEDISVANLFLPELVMHHQRP